MSHSYLFCISDVVCLEPCTKDPYVEGDRKTVRSSTIKRHFRQKTTASNLLSLWLVYAYRRLWIWFHIPRSYTRALYIKAYSIKKRHFRKNFKKRSRQRPKGYKHTTSRTSRFQGTCALIRRSCQCRQHIFFVSRMLYVGCGLFGTMYERALRRGRQENGTKQHSETTLP